MDITANQSRFREVEGKTHIRNLLGKKKKTRQKTRIERPSPPHLLHTLVWT